MSVAGSPPWLNAPAAWTRQRIKYLGRFFGGGTPSKDNLLYWAGDIPWVSPKDMKHEVVSDTEDHITRAAVRESATQLVPVGSMLVVVRSGILQHTIPTAINSREVALNQDMKAFVARDSLSVRFFRYLLHGFQDSFLLAWRKVGATVESLDFDLLRDTVVAYPERAQQERIAAFLDRKTAAIDALIGKKERLIELLQEKRQALITQGVTKGLEPNVPMKESGIEWLGEIPTKWSVLPLKRFASVDYGASGELDRTVTVGTPIISLPNVTKDGRLILLEELSLRQLDPEEYKTCVLRKGDLLFNWRNGSIDHVGKTALFDVDGEFTHVSFLLRVRLDPRRADPVFFWLVLNGLRASRFFASSKFQVNVTYNQTELRRVPLPLPPIDEQRQIARILQAMTSRIDALSASMVASVERLREYRQALITAAVTGKIDVLKEAA